ncbi:SDR family NAD(P)-dependent oxidoreductase [uncultured Aeromicrobium sp.]|uniref:SDR family NAD(P)-dependent oxidoreductase n=1 Tax=uncultured Aeromicrobium sp. TaxID=337820 RepID=UPI0025CF3EC4|nr:SDR family oxidoreductase [uncultured Aeromicrobium sp.]
MSNQPLAVVTGASSGIGAATARALAAQGYRVVCAARRTDRIESLASQIGGTSVTCDVTDAEAVAALAEVVGPSLDLLVNNAGGAIGLERVDEADPADWRRMYDVNVIGTLNVTRALLPALRRASSGTGTIVNVGSIAGHTAYEGGGGYTAAKHAVAVMTETLRLELNGEPLRISEVAPGMVHTEEFSLTRFRGDHERAEKVYEGVENPLSAEDVADAIAWIATRPAHVDIDFLVIKPVAQAASHKVARGPLTPRS